MTLVVRARKPDIRYCTPLLPPPSFFLSAFLCFFLSRCSLQLVYCILDMCMNVLKGKELRRREEGVRRKLRDCAGEHDSEGRALRRVGDLGGLC